MRTIISSGREHIIGNMPDPVYDLDDLDDDDQAGQDPPEYGPREVYDRW
jgi:hypothetical protein